MPPLSTRSRRAVDDRLHRLRDRFGSFPVETVTVENDREFFEHGIEIFEAGVRGAAGGWIFDDDGRVLFIRHPNIPDVWTTPGGGHEPGESFVETARREVWEETGVRGEVVDVWSATRKRFVLESNPERRGYLLEVSFDIRYVDGEAGRYPERWDDSQDEEILAVRWFSSPPDVVADGIIGRVQSWEWPDS